MEEPRLTLRAWLVSGFPPAPADADHAQLLAAVAAQQGLTGLLADVTGSSPLWPSPLRAEIARSARELLVRSTRQLDLAARVAAHLSARGLRSLPLKGAAVAEWLYASPAHRPMSDVDVLAIDDPIACRDTLSAHGFRRVGAADHAWALADPLTGGTVELHASPTSCPSLFPLDRDGLWARRHTQGPQVDLVPAPEDLLTLLALHATFQHGLVLTLVQWLDFRRLCERQPPTAIGLRTNLTFPATVRAVALALHAAARVVALPLSDELRTWIDQALPPRLRRWLERCPPLDCVTPATPALAQLRWQVATGRRWCLIRETLLAQPPGERLAPLRRVSRVIERFFRLALRRSS